MILIDTFLFIYLFNKHQTSTVGLHTESHFPVVHGRGGDRCRAEMLPHEGGSHHLHSQFLGQCLIASRCGDVSTPFHKPARIGNLGVRDEWQCLP